MYYENPDNPMKMTAPVEISKHTLRWGKDYWLTKAGNRIQRPGGEQRGCITLSAVQHPTPPPIPTFEYCN